MALLSEVNLELKSALDASASKASWLMISRWSICAYGALVNINAMVPVPMKLPDVAWFHNPLSQSLFMMQHGRI